MKKIVAVVLIAALAIGGVALFMRRQAQLAAAKPAPALPVVADMMVMERAPVLLTLPAMGVVVSELSTTLSTKVTGQILQVFKQEGDAVKKGERLALIDARELIAKKQGLVSQRQGLDYQMAAKREDLKAAQAALSAAREAHGRTQALVEIKGASIEQFRQEEVGIAQIEAQLAAAENGLSTLEKNRKTLDKSIEEVEALIGYTLITAPIDGTVSERQAKAGDLATPGKPLFSIAAGTGLYLSLSLPDTVPAREIVFQDKRIPLAPKNRATASGLVQYVAQLPDGAGVVEGQFINIRVVVFSGEEVLVPMDGLLSVGGQTFILVVSEDRAQQTPVHIKFRGSEGVTLEENIAGRRIVLAKPDILLRAATGAPLMPRPLETGARGKERS